MRTPSRIDYEYEEFFSLMPSSLRRYTVFENGLGACRQFIWGESRVPFCLKEVLRLWQAMLTAEPFAGFDPRQVMGARSHRQACRA